MHSQLWQFLQFLALLIHTRQQLHITLWEWNNPKYNPLENDQVLLALHWLSKLYAGRYGGKSRNADARFSCSSILLFFPSHVSCRIFSKQLELSKIVIWKHEQPESFPSWSLPRPTSQCCLQVFWLPQCNNDELYDQQLCLNRVMT